MRKIILAVIGLALFLPVKIYAYDDGDFQVWNTNVEEIKVSKNSKIAFEEEFRWGDNAGEFCYQHYDAGIFYDLWKWANVGGGYRQIYDLVKGKFRSCQDPYLTLTLSGALKNFKFENRTRLEYNDFNYKDDFWRYRGKFTLKFPWKFTKIEIQPYVSDEVFFPFSGVTAQFNQNRFSAGFSMKLTKNLKAEIYYLLQDAKSSGKWVETNVLGMKLKIAF